MTVYHKDHKILYFAPWGTGSSSVRAALLSQLGAIEIPAEPVTDPKSGRTICRVKHSTLKEIRKSGILEAEEIDSCFKFSTVRNPYDFAVSEYMRSRNNWYPRLDSMDWLKSEGKAQEKKRQSITIAGTKPFPDWVAFQFGDSRPRSLHGDYWRDMDYIMRFDSLQADLDEALNLAKVDETVMLEPVNVTESRRVAGSLKKRPFSEFYDQESSDIIWRVFAPDFMRFGWERISI